MNFIKFSKSFIYLKFGYQFEQSFSDFKIQLDGPFDFKIVCDNSDYRALSLFFRKDQVLPFSENILMSNTKKQREYEQNRIEWVNSRSQKKPVGQIIFDADDSIVVEHRLIKQDRNGAEIKQLISEPLEPQLKEIDYDGDDFEIKIAFTSRLNRDAFIMATRIITAVRSVVLAPLIDHTDKVFRRQWELSLSVQDGDYNQLVGQMHDFGSAIKRVLKMNKSLDNQNGQLNSCVEALEEDLQIAFTEFKSLLEGQKLFLGAGKTNESVLRVQKSMLETSMHLEEMKKGAQATQIENKKF